MWAPVAKLTEEGVTPFICEAMAAWAGQEGVSKENIHVVFVIRLDVLGRKYHVNLCPTVRLVSDFISQNPKTACAVVIAPNTGKDDVYNEASVDEAVQEVEDLLRQDTWAFRVKRGSLPLQENSLGKSFRPGFVIAWMLMSDARDPANQNKYVSDFEKSFLFRRGRSLMDLPVLPTTEYLNPCAPLARGNRGSDSLTKAQRSKQWHTGIEFWNGVRASVLQGLGLRVSDGLAWIDLLPYDDKLQHSVIQAYSDRGVGSPTQIILSPIWAKKGVAGVDADAKQDNNRIDAFLRKSERNYCANRIRDNSLKIPGVPILEDASAPAGVAPVLDTAAYVKTCPNAAGSLPIRQEILDTLEHKIKADHHREALKKLIEEHNKNYNVSGMPFKGEGKRPAPSGNAEEKEAQTAKMYAAEPAGPKSVDEFEKDMIVGGQTSEHEFCFKEGKLWAHALEDCIVSAQKPIVKFWGEYLCGTEKKKDIARFKNDNYMWEIKSSDFVGAYGWQKSKEVQPFREHMPCKLTDFMAFLEEKGRVNFGIECHTKREETLQPGHEAPNQPAAGVEAMRFEIKSSEDCLFLPKSLPAKAKPSKANAASAMDFSQWKFQEGTHKLGRVRMVPAMNFDEEANAIIPVKPIVYLTTPIKMKKDDFVLLG